MEEHCTLPPSVRWSSFLELISPFKIIQECECAYFVWGNWLRFACQQIWSSSCQWHCARAFSSVSVSLQPSLCIPVHQWHTATWWVGKCETLLAIVYLVHHSLAITLSTWKVSVSFTGNEAVKSSAVLVTSLNLCSYVRLGHPWFNATQAFRWNFISYRLQNLTMYSYLFIILIPI